MTKQTDSTAEYIASMADALKHRAAAEDLPLVAYLLDMVRLAAEEQASSVETETLQKNCVNKKSLCKV